MMTVLRFFGEFETTDPAPHDHYAVNLAFPVGIEFVYEQKDLQWLLLQLPVPWQDYIFDMKWDEQFLRSATLITRTGIVYMNLDMTVEATVYEQPKTISHRFFLGNLNISPRSLPLLLRLLPQETADFIRGIGLDKRLIEAKVTLSLERIP